MNFQAGLRSICADIAELAEGTSSYHANLARILAEAGETSVESASSHYLTADWWGGSGSMADLIIPGREGEYEKRLVDLVQLFEDRGIHCPRALQWAGVFQDWLKDGIWSRNRGSS